MSLTKITGNNKISGFVDIYNTNNSILEDSIKENRESIIELEKYCHSELLSKNSFEGTVKNEVTNQIEDINVKLSGDISVNKESIIELGEEIRICQNNIINIDNKIKDLKDADISNVSQTIKDIKDEQAKVNDELNGSIDELTKNITGLHNQYNELFKNHNGLSEIVLDNKKNIESNKSDITTIQENVFSLNEFKKDVQNKIENINVKLTPKPTYKIHKGNMPLGVNSYNVYSGNKVKYTFKYNGKEKTINLEKFHKIIEHNNLELCKYIIESKYYNSDDVFIQNGTIITIKETDKIKSGDIITLIFNIPNVSGHYLHVDHNFEIKEYQHLNNKRNSRQVRENLSDKNKQYDLTCHNGYMPLNAEPYQVYRGPYIKVNIINFKNKNIKNGQHVKLGKYKYLIDKYKLNFVDLEVFDEEKYIYTITDEENIKTNGLLANVGIGKNENTAIYKDEKGNIKEYPYHQYCKKIQRTFISDDIFMYLLKNKLIIQHGSGVITNNTGFKLQIQYYHHNRKQISNGTHVHKFSLSNFHNFKKGGKHERIRYLTSNSHYKISQCIRHLRKLHRIRIYTDSSISNWINIRFSLNEKNKKYVKIFS